MKVVVVEVFAPAIRDDNSERDERADEGLWWFRARTAWLKPRLSKHAYVARAAKVVGDQRTRIEGLRWRGCSTADVELLLATFENTLCVMREHVAVEERLLAPAARVAAHGRRIGYRVNRPLPDSDRSG